MCETCKNESAVPAVVISACTRACTQPLPFNQSQGSNFYVQATKHDHVLVLTEVCWPLPLYLFRQGIQWLVKSNYWYLPRIQVVDCTFDYTQGVLEHCHHVGRFKDRWKQSSRTDHMTFWLITCMVCCQRYIFQSLIFTLQDSLCVIKPVVFFLSLLLEVVPVQ